MIHQNKKKGVYPATGSPTATLLRLHYNYKQHFENVLQTCHQLFFTFKVVVNSRWWKCWKGEFFWVQFTFVVWRAVCTRLRYKFTVAFWSTITSDSDFMFSSCREQSELGWWLEICSLWPNCIFLSSPL